MQSPFPLFGALNVPYRIIELLHTNRHRELLSVGSEVQILSGTPESTAASLFRGLQRFLLLLLPVISTFVTGKFLCADTRAAIQKTRNEYSCRRELAAGAFVV